VSAEATEATRSGTRAVVLVHGIFDTAGIFRRMARLLRARGWTPHAVSLRPNTGRAGLDTLALQLKAYIDGHIGPGERIHLVGFSMGGLVARYYVQRLDGAERVRRFITLSAPHHGSRLAYLLANEACRQMRPGSAFLADL
jgi:triacylglycerol lipase